MIRIILLRHGETTWNVTGRYQGRGDTPLSEHGIEQGKCAARALQDIPIDAYFASPLSRAYDTCKFCAEMHNPPVPGSAIITDKRLMEICHGDWEGMFATDIQKRYPRESKLWHTHPEQVQMPGAGGESIADVQVRAMAAINDIIVQFGKDRQYKQDANVKTILIVAHDAVNKAILCGVTGLPLSNFWLFKQDNACLDVIEYGFDPDIPDAWRIVLLNNTAHMGYIYSGIEQKSL